MRLIVSGLILMITALDFRFGFPGSALHVAGLVAGILLAFSYVVDRLIGKDGGSGPAASPKAAAGAPSDPR